MYVIVRLLLIFIFILFSFMVINKSKIVFKRILYIVFICLALLLYFLLMFLPFENRFITFGSQKTAYKYYYFGESNIKLIVDGVDCDFVINRKNDSDTYLIIPKTENGWKIGIGLNTKRVAHKFSNGVVLEVYQYKNTNDYFITIIDTNGGETSVSDEFNTKFFSLKRYNGLRDKYYVTYYAHITNFHLQYSVIVNENKIVLGN